MGRRRGCGCFFGLGTLFTFLLVAALVVAGAIFFLQSPRVIDKLVGTETGAKEGLRVVDYGSLLKGQLHIELPDEVWQKEVEALFPLTESVVGFVKLHLRNPRFVLDPDPSWLRLELDLVAEVASVSSQSFPGKAALRTKLKLGPERRSVLMSDPELAEFTFTGEAGRLVQALEGVLKDSFADELRDFPVFELEEGAGWLQRQGAAFLQDVKIRNHKVVIVLGR